MFSSTGISRWLRLGCLLASLLFASYAVGQYLPSQQIPFDSLEVALYSLTTEALATGITIFETTVTPPTSYQLSLAAGCYLFEVENDLGQALEEQIIIQSAP